MKILVINNDLMERSVIQQVLQSNKHEVVLAGNSDAAMQLLREGTIRFVIADRATTDIDEQLFIQRLREANPPYYIYVLLIVSKSSEADLTAPRSGADDYLNKPVVPLDLKSRVLIGERILGLSDELLQAREALNTMAMFDPLTHMFNPGAFLALSKGELERARRNQAPLSLIALQINNLSEINDKHGPGVGNDVLTVAAHAIREKSRPYDGAGHFEHALFLVPFPFVFGQDAIKIANRLFKGVLNADYTLLDGTAIQLNIGVGVVSASRVTVSTEMETLIAKARETLERVQRNGGNQLETVFL